MSDGSHQEQASLESAIAARDVECPDCGYNLRGLRGRVCPECGAAFGWGILGLWGPRSEPRVFRSVQTGLILAALAGMFLLGARLWPALRGGRPGPIAAAVILPLASFVGLALWLRHRHRAARWARARQGRIATMAWLLLAAELLVIMADVGL